MLLTLVENAIKHGIAPQTEGGAIGIVARADARRLRIEVRDTGAGLSQVAGSGMGLANVRARLAALFGAAARLVIEPNAPRGVVAAIEIPR
ncbi:Sensor histidine kinase YpdA [compost metagenome]